MSIQVRGLLLIAGAIFAAVVVYAISTGQIGSPF